MEDLIERLGWLCVSDPEAVQLAIAELRRLTAEVAVLKEELRFADQDYRDVYRELQRARDDY